MDDIDINIAMHVAMGETISNLAHAYKNLSDEDMQQVVKVAAHLCLRMMSPPQPSAHVVGLDGGKMQ